jgi:hypothetical protein
MATNIPYDDAGMAAIQTEDFGRVPLWAGEAPIVTTPEVVADATVASADLPAFSVVGRDANGKLVMAKYATDETAIAPIGVTCSPVLTGATAKNVAVYRGGFFNMAALNWDASFDTDAKKRLAFEASAPGIFVGTIPTYGD